MMNLSDRMKTEAVGLGLCAKWTAEWSDRSSKDAMVDKFVRGIDFCIKHDWPSCDVIKRDFGDVIHNHGVYVDEAVRLRNPKPVVVLNGACDAHITFDGYAVCTVYVRHRSQASIVVKDKAMIRVCVYDGGAVAASRVGRSACSVYVYGGKVVRNDGVRVVERR